MGRSVQSKVEEMVYDAVFEISDEFDLGVDSLPEVYYVYPGFSFDKIGCPAWCWEDFKGYSAHISVNPKIIFITDESASTIFEEAGHFLHFSQFGLRSNKENKKRRKEIYSISEMLGYFSSKLVDSGRRPLYSNYPDVIDDEKEFIKKVRRDGLDFAETWIYYYGYNWGEKLFNSYISGGVSSNFIRDLFMRNLNDGDVVTSTFFGLKDFFEKKF